MIESAVFQVRRHAASLWIISLLQVMPVAAQPDPGAGGTENPMLRGDGDADLKRQAREAFELGLQLAQQGSYAAAKQAFLRAQALLPHPVVLYNAALACRELGELEQALGYLEEALSSAGRLSEAEQLRVENEKRELELLLGERNAPAPVPSETPPVKPTPAPPKRAEEPMARRNPPRSPPSYRLLDTWPVLTLSGGLVLLVSAGTVYAWNGERHDDWQQEHRALNRKQAELLAEGELPSESTAFVARVRTHNDRLKAIRRADVASVVLLASGAVMTATGLWLGLRGNDEAPVQVFLAPWPTLQVQF